MFRHDEAKPAQRIVDTSESEQAVKHRNELILGAMAACFDNYSDGPEMDRRRAHESVAKGLRDRDERKRFTLVGEPKHYHRGTALRLWEHEPSTWRTIWDD